jgi:hypothetical protein
MSATHLVSPARAIAAPAARVDRIAGLAALAFVVIVGLVNLIIGSMAPPAADAPASAIAAFFADNRTVLTVAAGMVPFGVIALFTFLASSFRRFAAGSGEGAFWGRLGAAGLVLVEVMFLTRFVFELVMIAGIDRLSAEPMLVEALWRVQGAATILTGLALAVALIGLARAARLSGLTPAWNEALGFAAAAGFLIAAVAGVPALEGSPIGLVGLVAFIGWLTWLAHTGVRFLRTAEGA